MAYYSQRGRVFVYFMFAMLVIMYQVTHLCVVKI